MAHPYRLRLPLTVPRGATYRYRFGPLADAAGTPVPDPTAATFDLVPAAPAAPQLTATVPASLADGRLRYDAGTREYTLDLDEAVTAGIPAGAYRAELRVTTVSGDVLVPAEAYVRAVATGAYP